MNKVLSKRFSKYKNKNYKKYESKNKSHIDKFYKGYYICN